MRRASLSINVIILIALGLIVLIILAVIVAGQARKADNTISNCEGLFKGQCMKSDRACVLDEGRAVFGGNCDKSIGPTAVCCVGGKSNPLTQGDPQVIG